MTLAFEVHLPEDLTKFRLPEAVAARLQSFLDRQDLGQPLTIAECDEAEGLVNLAELLTLLRLRAERASVVHHLRNLWCATEAPSLFDPKH